VSEDERGHELGAGLDVKSVVQNFHVGVDGVATDADPIGDLFFAAPQKDVRQGLA